MFATKCSFCQFENVQGARFCAECGSPLHLKVCPGCGKVSDVTASTCEHCHAAFPRLDLSPHSVASDAASPAARAGASTAKPSAIPPAQSNEEVAPGTGMRAWPLIVVALVAGGLPLLWFNRASLPEPKTFTPPPVVAPSQPAQQSAGNAPGSATPASSPAPPPIQATPPVTAPVSADPAGSAPTTATQPSGATAEPASPRPAKPTGNGIKRHSADGRSPSRKVESAQECTEAVAALGLCDPKQQKR